QRLRQRDFAETSGLGVVQPKIAEQFRLRFLGRNAMNREDLELLVAQRIEAADRGVVVKIRQNHGQTAFAAAARERLQATGKLSRPLRLEAFEEMEQTKDLPFAARRELLGGTAGQSLVEGNDENPIEAGKPQVTDRSRHPTQVM